MTSFTFYHNYKGSKLWKNKSFIIIDEMLPDYRVSFYKKQSVCVLCFYRRVKQSK